MDTPRPCGCKGKRTCLICERDFGLNHNDNAVVQGRVQDVEVSDEPRAQNHPDSDSGSSHRSSDVGYYTAPKENLSDSSQKTEHHQLESVVMKPIKAKIEKSTSGLHFKCTLVPVSKKQARPPQNGSASLHSEKEYAEIDDKLSIDDQLSADRESLKFICRQVKYPTAHTTKETVGYDETHKLGNTSLKQHSYTSAENNSSFGLQTAPLTHHSGTTERTQDRGPTRKCICTPSTRRRESAVGPETADKYVSDGCNCSCKEPQHGSFSAVTSPSPSINVIPLRHSLADDVSILSEKNEQYFQKRTSISAKEHYYSMQGRAEGASPLSQESQRHESYSLRHPRLTQDQSIGPSEIGIYEQLEQARELADFRRMHESLSQRNNQSNVSQPVLKKDSECQTPFKMRESIDSQSRLPLVNRLSQTDGDSAKVKILKAFPKPTDGESAKMKPLKGFPKPTDLYSRLPLVDRLSQTDGDNAKVKPPKTIPKSTVRSRLNQMKGTTAKEARNVIIRRKLEKKKDALQEWDPHKLDPDPLRWGGEPPFRWENNLRSVKTTDVVASHPHDWVPVGKHEYSRYKQYPFWPDFITTRAPWFKTDFELPYLSGSTQMPALLCMPERNRALTCYPVAIRGCLPSCGDTYLQPPKEKSYVFCPWCNKAWPGWDLALYQQHPYHSGEPIEYPGVYIEMDWLDEKEEDILVQGMDKMPWDASQSGRRKQNFGPKCNFKKMKMKLGDFNGFPSFSQFVQEKFKSVPILEGYHTIEQCSLEYDPSTGASIDPHIDDCWIWGERIVTVNLLSDTVLTMTPYLGEEWRYNLPLVSTYDPVLNRHGVVVNKQIKGLETKNESKENSLQNIAASRNDVLEQNDIVVRIPMPRRSLLVIYGPARYLWEHRVLREDVTERRLCLAYREFTPPYLPGGEKAQHGSIILEQAQIFWN